jgi:hypothetical protein
MLKDEIKNKIQLKKKADSNLSNLDHEIGITL